MAVTLSVERLRAASPADQCTLLRAALNENPQTERPQITDLLVSHIREGSLSPTIIQIWLGVAREPAVAVDVIQKCWGTLAWQYGVKSLFKLICNETTFKSTWDLIGGAEGLMNLMSELSLKDIQALCKAIERTAKSGPGDSPLRVERQEHMSELLLLLSSKDRNPDQRPLRSAYARIAPACTPAVAQEWAKKIEDRELVDANGTVGRGLREAHCDVFKPQAFDKVFSGDKALDLKPLAPFCDQDFDLVLAVVEKLSKLDSLRPLTSKDFLRFIDPFARRALKHKRSLTRFWDLIIECLRKHDRLKSRVLPVRKSWSEPAGLISSALKAWRHDSTNGCSDDHLAALISFIGKAQCTPFLLGELASQASPSMRYPLTRLFFKHAVAYQFDLGPPSNAESAMLSGVKLPSALLDSLPRAEALPLFERFLEANPSMEFLHINGWREFTLMDQSLNPEGTILDVQIIRAILIREAPGNDLILPADLSDILENLRAEELERRKREATRGQDSEKRGFYAESALALAIALGDVKLMTETLVWCRRFLRDHLAAKRIFDGTWYCARETSKLVTALDTPFTNTEDILAAVYQANEFLLCYLETASLALREPSFDPGDWKQPLSMITTVAENRLARINELQDKMNWSDDEVYNTVLQPTLDLIIDAESQVLKVENERLYPQGSSTLISIPTAELATTRQPALRFLDAVAKARDGMWLKARVEENPAVFTLQGPWPRGLTLGSLTGSELQYNLLNVPYVEQRAESVIFGDPKLLLAPFPGDEETQLAVGGFIENWIDALTLWVARGKVVGNREDRVRRAWNYALNELSRDRMTREEAERFWRPAFEQACIETELLGIDQSLDNRLPAELPQQPDIPGQPEEWDPDPMLNGFSRRTSKKRILAETTSLDRMLHPVKRRCLEWRSDNALDEDFEIPIIPPPEPPKDFWELMPPKGSSLAHSYVDAFIAAAVLSLNSTHGSESALLKAPFPNTSDSRFPAIYLEEQFLERTAKSHSGALEILTRLNKHTPPRLLETLASSMLERMESDKKSATQTSYEVFTKVVKLLSRGNEPSLATPLIARFVLDFPDASAWHRAVLNKGTINPLGFHATREFFSSLCSSFAERLSFKVKKKAFLKVTTVKMILDLLGNTQYLGPSLSFDIIAKKLLRHDSHVSVRVKALESLLEVYKENPTTESLEVLRTYAVPMAASLNERLKPLTEADWEAIENSDAALPEVAMRLEGTPVVDLLQSGRLPRDFEEIADLAYEAQRLSVKENARWIKLFLKRNGYTLTEETMDILCSIPKAPWDISATFSCSKDAKVPRDLFQAVARYHLLCLRPPQEVKDINEAVKKTPQYSISHSAVRWLELTESARNHLSSLRSWAVTALPRFMLLEDEPDNALTESSVAVADLTEYFIEISKAAIANTDLSEFNYIIKSLHPSYNQETGMNLTDKGAGRVISYLTEFVDSLRTPEWQSNLSRQPSVLPPIFPLQLRSFKYCHEKLPVYIDQVLTVLSSLVDSGKPYHSEFRLLEAKICDDLSHVYLSGAQLLGSVANFPDPRHPTLLEHLRVALACSLLRPSLRKLEKDRKEEAQELLAGWKDSSVEEFRDLARDLHLPRFAN